MKALSRRLLSLGLLAVALVGWGCSGGDSQPSSTGTSPAAAPVAATATATPVPAATPTPVFDAPPTAAEIDAHFDGGMKLLEAGSFQEALSEFDLVVRFRPDFADGHLGRGVANFQLENSDEAIADFTRVIELDPERALAYRNRGILKVRGGDGAGATDDLQRALNLYTEADDEKGIADIYKIADQEFMQ